jgi:DNA mismatch repair protein MutL
VAHPGQSKATRKGQYLFLNGRWIQDRSLQHALSEAYRGLLMVGRQPIAFLFLEAPAEDVDVNVHPTKCEVRFRDPQRFYRLLLSTLRTKFLTLDLHSALNVPRSGALMGDKPAVDPERQLQAQQELVTWAKEQLANWQPKDDLSDLEAKLAACEVEESWSPLATPRQDPTPLRPAPALAETSGPQHSGSAGPIVHATTPSAATRPVSASAELRAMQVHDCYLVVETGDGLTVIDQHALHERILYEHLRRRVLAGSVEVQKLLMPVTVELTAREAGLLLDRADVLAELGLSVAPFGGQTVALEAYPTLLARADPADLLRSIVEHLETSSQEIGRHDLLDGLLHMMACKAAIKAGQRLAPEEIATLIAQRHLVDDHHHCPHGRPTALTLSRAELDRQFGRLG